MTNNNNNLLTVSEAIALLGISRATFDRWKKEKKLPYIKIGKEVFVNKEKLDIWMSTFDFSDSRQAKLLQTTLPVHIGYQSGSAQLWSSIIIKRLGLLDAQLAELLPEQSFDIHWHHANNGIELVQQFVADKLNFIAVGDYPIHISFNLAKLFPSFNPLLIAFDGKTVSNQGIALVMQNEHMSNKTLQIATVPSTSSSYHLHQLLKKQQRSFTSVAKLSMEHCMNSLLQQEVEGAMLWEPYLSAIEDLGVGKRMPMEDNSVYLTGILANKDWLSSAHQQQIAIGYLKALLLAHQLLEKKDALAIQAIVEETSFSAEFILKVISNIRFDAIIYHEDIKRINNIYTDSSIGHLFLDSSMNDSLPPKIDNESSYLNEAIIQLNLPEVPKQSLTGKWIEQRY